MFVIKYDLIFLLSKSAAEHLFHQYKIKLLLEKNIILVYEHFHNLNRYRFIKKKQTLKWKVCIRAATIRNVSWVISNMVATNAHFVIADSTFKEYYEIIMLIYNRKTFRLDLLW